MSEEKPEQEFVIIKKPELMPVLLREFPGFQVRWDEHLKWWDGEPAGDYNDMAEFVQFVIEDLYEKQESEALERVFNRMEEFLV